MDHQSIKSSRSKEHSARIVLLVTLLLVIHQSDAAAGSSNAKEATDPDADASVDASKGNKIPLDPNGKPFTMSPPPPSDATLGYCESSLPDGRSQTIVYSCSPTVGFRAVAHYYKKSSPSTTAQSVIMEVTTSSTTTMGEEPDDDEVIHQEDRTMPPSILQLKQAKGGNHLFTRKTRPSSLRPEEPSTTTTEVETETTTSKPTMMRTSWKFGMSSSGNSSRSGRHRR